MKKFSERISLRTPGGSEIKMAVSKQGDRVSVAFDGFLCNVMLLDRESVRVACENLLQFINPKKQEQ